MVKLPALPERVDVNDFIEMVKHATGVSDFDQLLPFMREVLSSGMVTAWCDRAEVASSYWVDDRTVFNVKSTVTFDRAEIADVLVRGTTQTRSRIIKRPTQVPAQFEQFTNWYFARAKALASKGERSSREADRRAAIDHFGSNIPDNWICEI